MADINTIAKQFTEFYYMTFDDNRTNLQHLYRDNSMLSWEGQGFRGAASIVEKITGLPFAKVAHKVTTIDVQPSAPNYAFDAQPSTFNAQQSASNTASLVVLVTGLLIVDDSPNPLQFTQIFQLVPEGTSFYVLNDMFRLIYG